MGMILHDPRASKGTACSWAACGAWRPDNSRGLPRGQQLPRPRPGRPACSSSPHPPRTAGALPPPSWAPVPAPEPDCRVQHRAPAPPPTVAVGVNVPRSESESPWETDKWELTSERGAVTSIQGPPGLPGLGRVCLGGGKGPYVCLRPGPVLF